MESSSRERRVNPAGGSVQAGRKTGILIILIAVCAAALVPLGCATGEKRESVWVQIIPGRFYTFSAVKGETDGETLYVRGKLEAVGYFEAEYVPYEVIGRAADGEIAVKEESGRWMKLRSETFSTQVPYKPDLDYTIRAGREGLLTKIR